MDSYITTRDGVQVDEEKIDRMLAQVKEMLENIKETIEEDSTESLGIEY